MIASVAGSETVILVPGKRTISLFSWVYIVDVGLQKLQWFWEIVAGLCNKNVKIHGFYDVYDSYRVLLFEDSVDNQALKYHLTHNRGHTNLY